MALNFNFSNVKDLELVQSEPAVTDALIWATMNIGISKITEANVNEFYKRIYLHQSLFGAYLFKDGKEDFVTKQDVINRIGLYTNATDETRPAYIKRTMRRYFGK